MRDAEQTKQRLLSAALAEFSTYGIAGARVDRIAAAAGCNKALIYSYFGNKEQLFDAVVGQQLADVHAEVPIDVGDLPGYAVALYDRHLERPELLRLSVWHRLESDAPEHLEPLLAANRGKIAAIKQAQRRGTVSTAIGSSELLDLILAVSLTGAFSAVSLDAKRLPAAVRRRQRAAIRATVDAIVRVPDSGGTTERGRPLR